MTSDDAKSPGHLPGDPDCPCEVCYPPSRFTDADRRLALGLAGERRQGIAWPALGATDMPVAAQTADATQAELAEHGCLALRLFQSVGSDESNLLTGLEPGVVVLVRASGGGWIRSVVERDDLGWFVLIVDRRLDVTFNPGRGCCVVGEAPAGTDDERRGADR